MSLDQPGDILMKICGIRTVEHAELAAEHGADAIGLVLAQGSPRRLTLEQARAIHDAVPEGIEAVGVFRNNPIEQVMRFPGRWVQIHGDEDEQFINRLDHRVIRGFGFDREQLARWDACEKVEYLLVDSAEAGSGEGFDHEALADCMADLSTPVIIAGGLHPGNVREALRCPRPTGVDVSSGVESEPGTKEPALIRAFCKAVRDPD
ncbi:MAG: phosphoribosylanthranilate isomerase [Phycisphaerae bacterium]|nr:phosphoribosylanthranilate isomerase [Phycisphaerae bacterium]